MSGAKAAASLTVPSILGQTITRVLDSIKRDKILKRNFEKHVNTLELNVADIEEYRNAMVLGDRTYFLGDKDKRGSISKWYMELKDAMYDALDVLAAYVIAKETNSIDTWKDTLMNIVYTVSIHHLASDSSLPLARAIELINQDIDELIGKGKKHGFQEWIESKVRKYPEYRHKPTSSPSDDYGIIGRDKSKRDIAFKLRGGTHMGTSCKNLLVVPIVGRGGIGKTTLAQHAYNDIAKGNFDRRGWVMVSSLKSLDSNVVIGEILRQFTGKPLNSADSPQVLRASLEKEMTGKKFLLVMDDLWSKQEIRWEDLLTPLKNGKQGSKLVITTREISVVEKIKACYQGGVEAEVPLDILDAEDLWKILKAHAFGGFETHVPGYAERIGKKIVEKFDGLPLAAKAIGRILGADHSEGHWKMIQESDLWHTLESRNDENLVPALVLSFLHVPPEAKPCFTYCSLFSKEQEIKKTELVYQWLAHDYLLDKPEESAEDMGEEIINNLQNMSLVTIEEGSVQMHDLIHDMSTASGRDDHLQVSKDVKILENLQEERLRHLRIHGDECFSKDTLEKVGNCSMLRTLIWNCPDPWAPRSKLEASVLCTWFKQLQRLRVLKLNRFEIEELPKEIGGLKHLRYLDLSDNTLEELPDSLVNLHHLQALNLGYLRQKAEQKSMRIRYTGFSGSQLSEFFSHLPRLRYLDLSGSDIRTLPESILLLSDLRVLLLENCDKLRKLPDGIEKLKRLERLGLDGCCRIDKLPEGLGSLTKLTELNLRDCESLGRLGNQLAGLKNLKHLYVDQELMCDISGLTSLESWPYELQAGGIDQLANLNMLRGSLEIDNLGALESEDKAQQANLVDKVNLKELYLDWDVQTTEDEATDDETTDSLGDTATPRDAQNQQKVLECLKPYKHLMDLTISNYIGRILPNWLTSQYLLCLKRLWLFDLHIEVTGEIFMYGDSHEIFPFMEELGLYYLPKLYRWTGPGKSDRHLLPRLREIKISKCPKLEDMPDMPSSLETMSLDDVGLLKLPSLQHHSEEAGEALKPLLSPVQVSSLTSLEVRNCRLLLSLDNGILASRLPNLETLDIISCPNLKHPPRNGFLDFESLRNLRIKHCPRLMKLTEKEAEVGLPPHLQQLTIKDCWSLDTKSLQTSLETLSYLEHLTLKSCGGIDALIFKNNEFLEADILNEGFSEENQEDNATKILLRNRLRSLCSGPYQCTRFKLEANLVLCDEMLGECFYLLMNNEKHPKVNAICCGRQVQWLSPESEFMEMQDEIQVLGLLLEPEAIHIASCSSVEFLDKGILNYPWPLVRELTIVNYPNLVTPPKRGFITFPCLESLTLGDCPKLTKLSLEGGSTFPKSLQRLMIYRCDSLEVDSVDDSLQDPLISLRSFVLENGPRHVPNSFVKKVFSRLLQNLSVCTIRSDNFDFKWNQTDGIAGILWKWSAPHSDYCTPKEVIEVMPTIIQSSLVRGLYVEGYRDVVCGHLKKPFLNVTPADMLKVVDCEDLPSLLANMLGLESPQGTYDSHSTSESYDNQRNVCTHSERQEVSLKSLKIMYCNGSQDLSGSLNNHFPWLQELVISNCLNLEDLPKTGFMAFVSLERLLLVNCPKLSKLALEDNCPFPPCLYELRIKNCRGLETESLQVSLDQAAEDKSIRILELENCCRPMTNSFLKDVVAPLLETIEWCEIKSDDLQLCMFVRKGTRTQTAESCPHAEASFLWDYDARQEETTEDRVESCSRVELLKHILGYVGPSSIKRLEIHEARDLILVNGLLGQSLHKLINHDTHLALYQFQGRYRERIDFFGNKDGECKDEFCIKGCENIKSLHEGILSYPLPHVRRLLIENCVNMEDPPVRDFSTLTALESLTLKCCPKLTKLSSENCSALPPSLQQLEIWNCASLEPDSIQKSLQGPFPALRVLVLINSPRCVSNSFVKWVITRFLSKLSYCEISSTIFKFHYSGAEVSIQWMEENNEDTGDRFSRIDLVVEILKQILSHHVEALKIGGLHELKAIEGTLKQLLLGLQHLRDLTIVNCGSLCSLPIAEMEDNLLCLRSLQIESCGNLPRLKRNEYPRCWYYTHTK